MTGDAAVPTVLLDLLIFCKQNRDCAELEGRKEV